MFAIQIANHTIKGDKSKCFFFLELCPFFDWGLFILYQAPHSRALAPACDVLVLKIVRRGENVGNHHYLLFQQYFLSFQRQSSSIEPLLVICKCFSMLFGKEIEDIEDICF